MNAVLWGKPEEAIRDWGHKLRLERQDQPGHGGDSGLGIPSKCQ